MTDAWDVLCGAVRPRGSVLFYDDNGGHPGMDAAEMVSAAASKSNSLRRSGHWHPTWVG